MKTFQMKWMQSCVQLVLMLSTLQSCVVDPVDPNKEKQKGELYFGVSQEGDVRILNDCSRLQAFVQDFGGGYNHTLIIRGVTEAGDQGAVLTVYYNKPEDLQSGIVYANIDDDFGSKPWFVGQVMTEISDIPDFKAYTSSISDESKTDPNAHIKFTRYDQTNGIVSGTFSYKAQEMTINGATGTYRQVTGTFENVVVFPTLDAANECYGGQDLPTPDPGNGNPSPNPNPNPNPNPGNSTKTVLNFRNNTFTSIAISLDGQAFLISPGTAFSFQGTASSQAFYSARTSGKTSSGTQVGLEIQWSGTFSYPATGTQSINFDVPGNYFYLKVVNNSAIAMNKVYVNYGLTSETVDNVVIANNGQVFGLGYYAAYSNSNVRAENGNTYWAWNNLGLTGASNQSVTLQGN